MEAKKIAKKLAGHTLIGTAYSLKLAKWGLSAGEVVLNGAKNLADSFVKGPNLNIGQSLFKGVQQQTGRLADKLLKSGKNLIR